LQKLSFSFSVQGQQSNLFKFMQAINHVEKTLNSLILCTHSWAGHPVVFFSLSYKVPLEVFFLVNLVKRFISLAQSYCSLKRRWNSKNGVPETTRPIFLSSQTHIKGKHSRGMPHTLRYRVTKISQPGSVKKHFSRVVDRFANYFGDNSGTRWPEWGVELQKKSLRSL
jgi:hypothetical protein